MDIYELMEVALSGEQIKDATGINNIVTLSELKHFKTLKQLLGRQKACILLYETSENYGHWCCIFEVSPDLVEFFDPYGFFIDSELKYVPQSFKDKKNLNHTFIIRLLLNSSYKYIEWNNFPLQSQAEGVNTCGRHVILRLLHRDKTLNEYYNMVEGSGMDADKFVTIKTKFIK